MANIINNLDWSILTDILISIIPALVCITFHELSHGFVAYRLGDPTAKMMGRLTLNPIKHIDIMGLIMMVVFKFGWAKPVPVDMGRFKNPKRDMAITALAGPASNIILAIIAFAIYGILFYWLWDSPTGEQILSMIYITGYLSIALAVFNLLPIPPLDGSKILFSIVSDEAYFKLMRYERYGMILLILVVATGILGNPLATVTGVIFDNLFNVATWFFDIVTKFV